MKLVLPVMMISLAASLPALAEGDAEKGKKAFNKCKACHTVVDDAGEAIIKGGKTGPNLYGVVGNPAAASEDFAYGDSLLAAAEKGLVWDEESFVAYTTDPKAFLKEYLDETSAKSKMSFRLKKGNEDIYAFLASVAE